VARPGAAQRWVIVATAWLETTRVAALAGARDDRDRPLAPLGPDLDRALAPEVRRAVLTELAALPRGAAADAPSLESRLRWHRPHRSALRHDLVGWTLRESEVLGVTGSGALSTPGRALLDRDEDAAVDALAPLLPKPLDHVLLQADLTAVAPGPLVTGLAAELALAAEIESRGGATVYRFTPASVRRALDAGRTAAELHDLLVKHSRTPVPQPLSYLVDDMARRHGRVRVGTASAYVRCDDDGLLAEILADRRSGSLGLRRLAATVLAAQSPVDTVLARLREMGYAPAAESPQGEVIVRRPDSRRTPTGCARRGWSASLRHRRTPCWPRPYAPCAPVTAGAPPPVWRAPTRRRCRGSVPPMRSGRCARRPAPARGCGSATSTPRDGRRSGSSTPSRWRAAT
jgi:hypothetical protein